MSFEISVSMAALKRSGFSGRSELAELIGERLRQLALGDVTTASGDDSRVTLDVEMPPHLGGRTGATILLYLMKDLGAPVTTVIRAPRAPEFLSGNDSRLESWSFRSLQSRQRAPLSYTAGSVSKELAVGRGRVSLELFVKYRRVVLRDASVTGGTLSEGNREGVWSENGCIWASVNATETVQFRLWTGGRTLQRQPAFDGPLRLRTGFLVLASMALEEFRCFPLGRGVVRLRVWTDAEVEPEKVWVQISD